MPNHKPRAPAARSAPRSHSQTADTARRGAGAGSSSSASSGASAGVSSGSSAGVSSGAGAGARSASGAGVLTSDVSSDVSRLPTRVVLDEVSSSMNSAAGATGSTRASSFEVAAAGAGEGVDGSLANAQATRPRAETARCDPHPVRCPRRKAWARAAVPRPQDRAQTPPAWAQTPLAPGLPPEAWAQTPPAWLGRFDGHRVVRRVRVRERRLRHLWLVVPTGRLLAGHIRV